MEPKNIFQVLWELDLIYNGCSVTSKDKNGQWLFPNADIKLDEQSEYTYGKSDVAPNPLFHEVNECKLQRPTYTALIALLDNYIVNARVSEDHVGDNVVEDKEINHFLDVILESEVMQAAYDYIINDLGISLTKEAFRKQLVELWFNIYTNYFNRTPVPFCSGFEHVFVGEGKASNRGIGGYHSWVKFYLDEKNDRVDFKGFNYDGSKKSSKAGSFNPYVATISMDWDIMDMAGNIVKTLQKEIGGFFVGPSPELQIAIPTVAYFESTVGQFANVQNSSTKKLVELHGALYHLVLYKSTMENQQPGDQIRSFFPKFLRPIHTSEEGTGNIEKNLDDKNNGIIVVTKALINPEGEDIGNEWIEIENRDSKILNLNGWHIADKMGRIQPLFDQIKPNKQRKILITRANANATQLGNKEGVIEVLDDKDNQIAKVHYGKVAAGEITYFSSGNEATI